MIAAPSPAPSGAGRDNVDAPTLTSSGRIAANSDVPRTLAHFCGWGRAGRRTIGYGDPRVGITTATRVRISARWRERAHASVRTSASGGGLFFHSHGEKDPFPSWIDENRKA